MEPAYDVFVDEVARLAALPERAQVERAIAATLHALGERLVDEEREALARELPPPLAEELRARVYGGDFDRDELVDRVARREGTSKGFAAEHLEAVCETLAELADEEVLVRLRKHLPADLAALFTRVDRAPEPPSPPHHREIVPGWGDTLATGRPASKHPVSTSRADRAHEHSVARADDPHADTKVSSAKGLTQERLDEDLATGRPASKKPVSEG